MRRESARLQFISGIDIAGGVRKCMRSSAVLAFILLPQMAAAFTASINGNPNPNTGDYTVSWSNPAAYTYKLQEMVIGVGAWSQVTVTTGTSYPFTGKAVNDYMYRLRWDKLVCTGYPEPECTLVYYYSETTTVTVEESSPPSGEEDPFPPPGPFTPPDDTDFPDAAIVNPVVRDSDSYPTSVGALQGKGGVSGGQASYTIPIIVPPGRKGMQPGVSLSYSSASGNGNVGVGWRINAASAISRCSATAAQDGFTAAPQYDANRDRLCLDGQRLMVVSGTYGQTGAQYRTELDTFALVTQSGGINSGSSSFMVQFKNGQTS